MKVLLKGLIWTYRGIPAFRRTSFGLVPHVHIFSAKAFYSFRLFPVFLWVSEG